MGKKYPKFGRVSFILPKLIICLVVVLKVSGVRIGITHWNDVSGQIESFERGKFGNGAPSPCPDRAEAVFQCVGGLRSLAHWLSDTSVYDENQVLQENILRLSSGNLIGGESGWISSIDGAWEKYGNLVKKHFRPHVTTLGMKEFGSGLDRTMDYMHGLGASTLTLANTCYQNQSSQYGHEEQEFCENYNIHQRIRILTVLDTVKYVQVKIGVIGFVNPLVEKLALPGKLKFAPVVPAIAEVVQQNKKDVSVFIAIGDGNLKSSKEIIDKVPEVKLVIYGTGFLKGELSETEYPISYKQGYVATAGRYGSSIGNLIFELHSETGSLELLSNKSKLVETSRPEIWNAAAQAAQTDYTKLEAQVRRLKEDILGQSRVNLQGGSVCWRKECNLGNLVCDAMVHCALRLPTRPFEFHVHAIWHSGAFFEDEVKAGSKISRFDIHKWLPFHNHAHLVRVNGSDLQMLFEASAGVLKSGRKNWGQFLQVSNGLEVYYDSKAGSVSRIRMTHDQNGVPQLSELQSGSNYYLVIPTFLYEGRGVYNFAKRDGFWKDVIFDNITQSNFAYDDECVEAYVRSLEQVSVGFEERIWINAESNSIGCNSFAYTAETVILTIFVFAACQAGVYASYLFVVPALRRRWPAALMEYPPNQL